MRKYHGEMAGPQHGDSVLNWPGTMDGFPVLGPRGQVNDLKKEELDNLDLRFDFKSRMFELWEPDQKADFDDVNDKIVNGWYRLVKRSDNWDDEKKHFRVWMEWFQVYGMIPPRQ